MMLIQLYQGIRTSITRLGDVSRRLFVFRAGVVSYYIGLYEESITMMEEFGRLYPSKEVYNNIGTAYHYLLERLNAPQLKERTEVDINKALSIEKNFSVASYNLKKSYKKGYFQKVTVDDKININIFDLPERVLTIVERNGVVGIVILRNKVDSEIKKG